jgi:hypothetical protein
MVPFGTVERTVVGRPNEGDVCALICLEQIKIDCQRSRIRRVHDEKHRCCDRREPNGSEGTGDRPEFVGYTLSE